MDVVKENIVKFIEELIVDDYSSANVILKTIVENKMKGKMKKAVKTVKLFKKGKKKTKSTK